MSLFLGPIHYKLYEKIQFQNQWTDALTLAAEKKLGNQTITEKANTLCPKAPTKNLEDVVDTTNIHASLQGMIVLVENRLAWITNTLLSEGIFTFDDILEICFSYGKDNAFEKDTTIDDVYMKISSKILNGMPCDRVEEIISQDKDNIVWQDRVDIHKEFWQNQGADSSMFYKMRSHVIDGLLSETSLDFSVDGLKYTIKESK